MVVNALDETNVKVESNNRCSWSPVGKPPILEKNGCRKGLNLIGSTSILNNHHTIVDAYASHKSITSIEIKSHIEYLLEINPNKKVVIFLDNARTHTSKLMQSFYYDKKDVLSVIFLPKYSPKMNPQEHMWNYYKANLYNPKARKSIYELVYDTQIIFSELNESSNRICSLAYARNYLV